MYTSYIGKKFLKLYNERESKDLNANQFFEDVFFQLFFNNTTHLMHVHGSSFFQKVSTEKLNPNETVETFRLRRLQNDIENRKISGSTYVGYAAETALSTTSGQVTSIDLNIDEEEMYASWLGEALGIGVSGGFVMLIDKEEILWSLFEGWKNYRQYLQQTPQVKDKQIETWNGHWLAHVFDKDYNPDDPWENFRVETNEVQGKIAIPTNYWSKVMFALSKKYPKQVITSYAYNLSQTNTTFGFINLYLPEVRKMYELRDAVFMDKSDTVLKDKEIENLQTFFNFRNACKLGTIGLKTLEPDKLRTYMPKGSVMYAQGKDFKFTDEDSFINYQLYKLWITAMLNKTELLNHASDLAEALIEIEKLDERGKKVFATLSKEVRETNNLKGFIEHLSKILENTGEKADIFKSIVEQVLKMPSDNFPLFITLVRFEYQYQKSKK